MKNQLLSMFSFGLVLIIVGAVGSFFDWSQSMIFIGLGLTLESLALLIFAWNKLRKK
ncbi:MAG: hypothetical protein JSV73_11145 [Flavobacteriaceae bacterium]|nr:MAG: hypothetical protein JSV73_11145 [Flavobacteriaceae bacterium]